VVVPFHWPTTCFIKTVSSEVLDKSLDFTGWSMILCSWLHNYWSHGCINRSSWFLIGITDMSMSIATGKFCWVSSSPIIVPAKLRGSWCLVRRSSGFPARNPLLAWEWSNCYMTGFVPVSLRAINPSHDYRQDEETLMTAKYRNMKPLAHSKQLCRLI